MSNAPSAANNIDVLTVQQLTAPSTYETVAAYANYNSAHEPQSYTGHDGQLWKYTYNAAGQPSTVTDPNGGVTTYNYDSIGRLSTVVNANHKTVLTLTYDEADRVKTRTDSEGYTLTYAYDHMFRVIEITYPDGTMDQFDYRFQSGASKDTQSLDLRRYIDRLGRATFYNYDADRRLISVTQPETEGTHITSYSYYEDGTLKEITDANGNVTHWDIDAQSRPISKTYGYGTSEARTETYAYEVTNSRLHSVTDALGQVKTITYAHDDRTTALTYTDSVNLTPNVSYSWDPYFPRLASMTDGTGTTKYAYVPIGTLGGLKLASIAGPFSNDTVAFAYDALGRLSGRNIPGGNESFSYDAISRLIAHATSLGTFQYGYLGQTDQTTSRSVTNGKTTVSTGWTYDTNANDRRLIAIANSGVSRSYALSYAIPFEANKPNPYDIMNIKEIPAAGHPFSALDHAYWYDAIDRLLSTTTGVTKDDSAFLYDQADNITRSTNGGETIEASYNSLNEIENWGTKNYEHDANGNTLNDGTRSYKWDAENRLIEIDYTDGVSKSTFAYDGLSHRIIDTEVDAKENTVVMRYLWCGERICQTRNSSDQVLRRDFREGEFSVVNGQELVYMPDQLGSARDVLDAITNARVESEDFSPFGDSVRTNGSELTDYEYAGLFYHPESGLNLAVYRAEDGEIGRFVTRDPLKERGGINLYEYAGSDPISELDPRGLWQFTLTIADGLGFQFTIGYNSGQLNVGVYAGVGQGGSWSWDPRDSGCAKTGLEVSDRISVSEDIIPGYAIDLNAEVFWNGSQQVEGDIDSPYGTYGVSLLSPGENSAPTVKFPISAGHGWGIGTFAGVGGTLTW